MSAAGDTPPSSREPDAPKKVRRLPVIQSTAESATPLRPGWQRVALTAVATTLVWLVSASIVGVLLRRALASATGQIASSSTVALMISAQLVAFGLAAAAGGYFVARLTKQPSVRQAAFGATLVAGFGSALAFSGPGAPAGLGALGAFVSLSLVGSAGAALGAKRGAT